MVGIAEVEKEKAIEIENRNIQEVIRERVAVERAVVEEKERIKDTEEFATAERLKKVQITQAEMKAEEDLIRQTKQAQAEKDASELLAEKVRIEAEAKKDAAEREKPRRPRCWPKPKRPKPPRPAWPKPVSRKPKRPAWKKKASPKQPSWKRKPSPKRRASKPKPAPSKSKDLAEANVDLEKYRSEATGITEKAEAMKVLDSVGKDHEEFKLQLNKEKDVEIAAIDAQRGIAESQAGVVGEALKAARIDIVGGDGEFFDQITSAVKGGKAIDRFVYNSRVATDIKDTFFDGNAEYFRDQLQKMIGQFNLDTDGVKDLSIAALIAKMMGMAETEDM